MIDRCIYHYHYKPLSSTTIVDIRAPEFHQARRQVLVMEGLHLRSSFWGLIWGIPKYICIYTCVYLYMYIICTCACVYVCIYYVCIYIYIVSLGDGGQNISSSISGDLNISATAFPNKYTDL